MPSKLLKRLSDVVGRYWRVGLVMPAIILLALVAYGGEHIPFWDQWEFVTILQEQHAGQLSFADFWAQHNEHRIFLPRLIMFGLAQLTGWDPYAELFVNVLLGVGILVVLLAMTRASFKGRRLALMSLLAAWFVLSPMQWENWLWGWQIQWFLSVLGAVIAVYYLTREQLTRRELGLAALGGLVSTFSLANGFVVWPIGLALLLLRREKRKVSVVWLATGLTAIVLYYINYHDPPYHPSKSLFLKQPLDFLEYFLTYVGRPLSATRGSTILLGVVTLAIFVTSSLYIWRKSKKVNLADLAWFGVGLYGLAGAILTSVSRLGFGVEQAATSRYTTIGVLLTIATVALGLQALTIQAKKDRVTRLSMPRIELAVFISLAVLGGATYIKGLNGLREQHRHLVKVEACLMRVTSQDDPCLLQTYPNGPIAFERLQFLRQHNLGGNVNLR